MKPALATDAQYLAAVKAGSVEWAQQMVDEAAKAAGYGIKVGGFFVKNANESIGKLPKWADEIYKFGKLASENGRFETVKQYNRAASYGDAIEPKRNSVTESALKYWDGVDGTLANYIFEQGLKGVEIGPFVFAERIGNAPERGYSLNYRDQTGELGVSVLGLLDPSKGFVKQNDSTFELFNDGERRFVGGFLTPYKGSDGEPLLIGIQFDGKRHQIKLADPITYDKSGKVIPLSQRFNNSSEEITNPVVPENEGIPFFHTTTKITKLEDVDISKTSPNSYLGQALYGVLEGGSWKPSHLKSGRILRGTVSGRIIDLLNVTNEDLKRIGQLIGRNIETVPFLTLEKRYGDIGKGLRAAGYSAAIHLGPANTGKHIAIFDVSKIKSIGVDEITNPAAKIPAQFPYEYASYLKQHFPEIWRLGGNIRGNDAFRWWTAYRQGDRSPTVMHWWTVTRPAWIARHYRDHLIAGVVAQIKWGTIGRLGVEGMKRVVETKIRNSR